MNYRNGKVILPIMDTFIIPASAVFSTLIIFNGDVPKIHFSGMVFIFIGLWLVHLIVFRSFKIYQRIWIYSGPRDFISIIKAGLIANAAAGILFLFLSKYELMPSMPLSVFVMTWMSISMATAGVRFLLRFNHDLSQSLPPTHKRVLIIGAGNTGSFVVKLIRNSPNTPMNPIAFIDDDHCKLNKKVFDLPIIGTRDDIPRIARELGVQMIIIAMPSAPKKEISDIIKICKETKTEIKLFPHFSEILQGEISLNMIRDVKVEDLLGREPIEIDLEEVASFLSNKTILITGAGGSIGSELCRQIARLSPKKMLLVGAGENSIFTITAELKKKYPSIQFYSIIANIQDQRRIETIFAAYKPNIVFHAAAYKHVPLMENNVLEAVKNNVFGTRNVAESAHRHKVERFVLISTDKAVNPSSIMGTTKKVAEILIQQMNEISDTKFTAVRFGNVLGSRGSVIPVFKKQIAEGGPVTVTHPEMVRYFMTIPEAVQLVIQGAAMANGGEIFVLDMGRPVNITKLANDLIRLSGFEPGKDIKIIYTGARPGEKLSEELFTSEENRSTTKHNLIYIAKQISYSPEEFSAILTKLQQLTLNESNRESKELKSFLADIVPFYSDS
ncbi:polysaccharide biosynthesis protein [Metabacillus idriensis]|uniref:polysaccharide biosynthesis protein n=1 Tax=Metabacillus idriensis TaxID=324768 RepID=UPI00174A22D1|nr:nucleoside-diphosphate sugar epimerase/dehydratase [Metabacillus idriensis]